MKKLAKNTLSAAESTANNERIYILCGWAVLCFGFLSFLLWAAFAPLDKGVTAQGEVTISGNRKTIQSADDGIIADILIKDGDAVKAGQLLVQLDPVQAQAQVDTLQEQYYTALATEGRLLAERDNLPQIIFPHKLTQHSSRQRIGEIINLQQNLFYSRQTGLQSEVDAYKQSMAGMTLEIISLQHSLEKKAQQLKSLNVQMNNMKSLANEGYIARNRYLEVEQRYAAVSSEIDETRGRIGKIKKQLTETQKHIDQRSAEYQRDVRSQLTQTQLDVTDYRNKLASAQFSLKNTRVIAPVDGTVVSLAIFTSGGVVSAGEHLLDIVPTGANLEVNARLEVDLVDKVATGLDVDLMFTAFNQNKTPKVTGEVSVISADRLVDQSNQKPYYKMQITVTPQAMQQLKGLDIKPGMPVQVFVKTGSRSLLNYLFKPVVDRAYTSLSED